MFKLSFIKLIAFQNGRCSNIHACNRLAVFVSVLKFIKVIIMSIFNKIFLAFMFFAFSGSINAALITSNGSNVSFSYDEALAGLIGISGDTLIFWPQDFSVSSENITGTVYKDSSFKVNISSLYGNAISSLALLQSGDYNREGSTASVVAKGTITTTDLTNNLNAVGNIQGPANYAPTTFDGPIGLWKANANAIFSNAFSVDALIHSILGAKSNAVNDNASIYNTFVSLTVTTTATAITATPLPQAVWLFGAGLLGLLRITKSKHLL